MQGLRYASFSSMYHQVTSNLLLFVNIYYVAFSTTHLMFRPIVIFLYDVMITGSIFMGLKINVTFFMDKRKNTIN